MRHHQYHYSMRKLGTNVGNITSLEWNCQGWTTENITERNLLSPWGDADSVILSHRINDHMGSRYKMRRNSYLQWSNRFQTSPRGMPSSSPSRKHDHTHSTETVTQAVSPAWASESNIWFEVMEMTATQACNPVRASRARWKWLPVAVRRCSRALVNESVCSHTAKWTQWAK